MEMDSFDPREWTCAVCGVTSRECDDIVVTPEDFLDANHPLRRFEDVVIHQGCFMSWQHREDFVSAFNDDCGNRSGNDSGGWVIHPDGTIEDSWANRTRRCPRCGHGFTSVSDRGSCPSCSHVFYASDQIHG